MPVFLGDVSGNTSAKPYLEEALEKDEDFPADEAPANKLNESVVSDIEVGREADTSVVLPANLDDSALLGGNLDKSVAADDGPQDIEFGQPDMGFENAYDDQEMMPPGADMMDLENPDLNMDDPADKSLNMSTDLNLSLNNGTRASIDFALAAAEDADNQSNSGKAATRQRKKRKIGRDSVTELSSAVLKKGMTDVSDIVRTREISCKKAKTSHMRLDFSTSSADLFTRPCTTDLADELLSMFKYTMKKRKFPFESDDRMDEQPREDEHDPAQPTRDEEEEDIEQTRRMSDAQEGLDRRESMVLEEDAAQDLPAHEKSFDLPEGPIMEGAYEEQEMHDFGFEAPMEPDQMQEDQPLEDLNLDIELAAVNDLQANLEGEEDQQMSLSTAQHKWHPHTVKVMKVLRKSLDEKKEVTYNQLTKHTQSRRTAAALFFELLQLKTLNYVDVDQSRPYGDIKISKATRFGEHIPAVDGDME